MNSKPSEVKVSFLVNQDDRTTITIEDSASNETVVEVEITNDELVALLSRQVSVRCQCQYGILDRIGKKMEHKKLEFPLSKDLSFIKWSERDEFASSESIKHIPDGWISDDHFSSQDSFFKNGDEKWARVTIRRWVEFNDGQEVA